MNVAGEGSEQVLTFRTNVGNVVEAGLKNPLRFIDEPETGGLKPYLLVRGRLEVLVSRLVMYESVEYREHIEIDGNEMFSVRSKGEVYPHDALGQAGTVERVMVHSRTAHYSTQNFRQHAAQKRLNDAVADYGNYVLNPDMLEMFVHDWLRNDAVLITIIDHDDASTVILTKRAKRLKNPSGQIGFPGEYIDPTDVSSEAAALHETVEEIGLPLGYVDGIGRLFDYVTGSGYRIAPGLSVVRHGFQLIFNEGEVADALEVQLDFLVDPANHDHAKRTWKDQERFFYSMPYEERYIWGFTAGVIRAFYERLYT